MNNLSSLYALKSLTLGKSTSSFNFPGQLRIGNNLAGADNHSAGAANQKTPQNSAAPPDIKSSLSDTAKFANEFSLRAREASGGDKLAADLLTDSFLALSREIASKLGQAEADKFQEAVLTATDNSFRLGDLVEAVGGFFSERCDKARAETALDLFGKLVGLKEFINQGLDIFIDEENILTARLADGETPGAAYALNKFFKTPFKAASDMESVETSGFDDDFKWTEMRVFKRGEVNENGEEVYYVNTGQGVRGNELIGSDSLREAADFLATKVGNNNAASLLNNLSAGENVMDALAMTVAIVAKENGLAKAGEYVSFLNANLKDAINSTLKGAKLEGWLLTSPSVAEAGANRGGVPLSLSGASDITNKGHSSLETNWRNANGIGVIPKGKDLNDLYYTYLNSII